MIWGIIGIITLGSTLGVFYYVKDKKQKEEQRDAKQIVKEYKIIREAVMAYFHSKAIMPNKMQELRKYLKEPVRMERYLLQAEGDGVVVSGITDTVYQLLTETHKCKAERHGDKAWLKFKTSEEPSALFKPDIRVYPTSHIKTTTKLKWDFHVPRGVVVVEEKWENRETFYEKPGNYLVKLKVKTEQNQWSEMAEVEIEVKEDQGLSMTSAGLEHFFILKKNGILFGGGGNAFGQLGNDKRSKKQGLTQIDTIKNVRQISAGHDHSLCITYQNDIYATGRNHHGQLGLGNTEDVYKWEKLDEIENVKTVVAGHGISAAITNDGRLYLWGRNEFGQIVDNGKTIIQIPTMIDSVEGVFRISLGVDHILALMFDKTILSWGGNKYGQLGDGTRLNRGEPTVLELEEIKDISCGDGTSFAVNERGQLYVWGKNTNQELGVIGSKFVAFPTLIQKVRSAIWVSAGVKGVATLSDDFEVMVMGFHEDVGAKPISEIEKVEGIPPCREVWAFSNSLLLRALTDDVYVWERSQSQRVYQGTEEIQISEEE